MGDPRKQRKKYDRPTHPWKMQRITEEKEICKKYGLKNKKEIWRALFVIRRYRQRARELLALQEEDRIKQTKELIEKLNRDGVIEGHLVEDVLALTVENLLDRRLQTRVYQKGLANTVKHARQAIIHGHVLVDGKKVSVPGYLVPKDEEDKITVTEKVRVKPVASKEAG